MSDHVVKVPGYGLSRTVRSHEIFNFSSTVIFIKISDMNFINILLTYILCIFFRELDDFLNGNHKCYRNLTNRFILLRDQTRVSSRFHFGIFSCNGNKSQLACKFDNFEISSIAKTINPIGIIPCTFDFCRWRFFDCWKHGSQVILILWNLCQKPLLGKSLSAGKSMSVNSSSNWKI